MKKLTNTIVLTLLFLNASFAQLTTVTSGLHGAAGIEADASGNIWLTETGTGASDGQVLLIRPDGRKDTVITGLPSFANPQNGETTGAWRTMSLPNNRLAVILGEGPTPIFGRILLFDLTGFQPNVSPAKTMADTTSTIDISRFSLAQEGVLSSNPFSAVLDSDGTWYVADAGANMVIKITSAGEKSVFARLPRVANQRPVGPPTVDAVPTKIIANPDGGFYLATLTGFPFNTGKATVYALSKEGELSVYAKNLTMVTDIALDYRTGDMYALQFAEFGFVPAPGFVFGSGKVHRIQRGGAYSEVVASNFGPGSGLALDANGNIYVTSLFTSQLLKMNKVVCDNFEVTITPQDNVLTLYTSTRYTLKITNKSGAVSRNIRVYWLPPYKRYESDLKPFAYQSAHSSTGYYDSWHGYWTIDSLAASESATVDFELFVVNTTLNATQTAEVVACNQPVPGFVHNETQQYHAFLKKSDNVLSVSPNPAYNTINVNVKDDTNKEWTVKLLNTLGQVITVEKGQNNRTFSMNVEQLKSGLYLVDYQSAGERKVEKVMVQH